MQAREYDTLRTMEDQHWWYAVLRHLVQRALAEALPNGGRVLDAGCGTGGMIAFLAEHAPALITQGVDFSALAVEHCRRRGLTQVLTASVHDLPFADESFDAVLSLDVLYHAEIDEQRAMTEMKRVLRPGGVLILNLPAFECLRGSHDRAVCGARRYRPCHVRMLARNHSLEIAMTHFWNAWLFLPLLLWRLISRQRTPVEQRVDASDLRSCPSWLGALLSGVGKVDARLCRALHVPWGSSIFGVMRKPPRSGGGES